MIPIREHNERVSVAKKSFIMDLWDEYRENVEFSRESYRKARYWRGMEDKYAMDCAIEDGQVCATYSGVIRKMIGRLMR